MRCVMAKIMNEKEKKNKKKKKKKKINNLGMKIVGYIMLFIILISVIVPIIQYFN